MKAAALIQHIAIAFVLTCMAAANQFLLSLFFIGSLSAKLNLSAIVLCYLCWLIWRNPVPVGRITLLAGNLIVMLIGLFAGAQLGTLLLLYPAMIWLNRSLLRYDGIVAVSADLTLCLLSIGAVYGVLAGGHGLIAALWCFLLLQALHTLIPGKKGSAKSTYPSSSPDKFNRALRSAEIALQQLLKKI